MISFIKGNVASYGTDWVIVENNGIGWQMAYPHCDRLSLNQEVKIHTYMHITENDMSLFGFESDNEKQLFLRLISVKGLGPKTAMNMLVKTDSNRIIAAIESGNVQELKKLPGIGAKGASQMVLDLKGKLVSYQTNEKSQQNANMQYTPEIRDALEALKSLGYKSGELNEVANNMVKTEGLTTQQYLKMGLQFLQKQNLRG